MKKKKKGAFYSYFYISLWCYLFDKFDTTLGIPCHWPISHLAFWGTFRQILAADKCMAPSYLFCPNPAPLLPWPGPKKALKALNVLPIFFFFPFLFFAFSQGYPHLFPVGSRADCPRWLNVCGANLWRCWVSWSRGGAARPAILGICSFPALPTFFYSFHGSQRADTLFFCHLFFLLGPFPSLGLSAGK